MHNIYFYRDGSGKQPVREYLAELAAKGDKDSRIKYNKIRDYIKALSEYGTQIGEPYIKHLDGDIWELRPLQDTFCRLGKRQLCITAPFYEENAENTRKRN